LSGPATALARISHAIPQHAQFVRIVVLLEKSHLDTPTDDYFRSSLHEIVLSLSISHFPSGFGAEKQAIGLDLARLC